MEPTESEHFGRFLGWIALAWLMLSGNQYVVEGTVIEFRFGSAVGFRAHEADCPLLRVAQAQSGAILARS
jgi:hypothetical protein